MTPLPESKNRNLIKRVAVGIVCGPALVWLFLKGGFPLFMFLLFLTACGQWELYRMFAHRLRFPHRIIGFTAGSLMILSVFFGHTDFTAVIIVFACAMTCSAEIISGSESRLETVALSMLAIVYPALFVTFLVRISGFRYSMDFDPGHYVLLYVILVIWTFDTVSYFAGRLFGRRPFFPSVSPKKTIEGFIGGIVGVLLLAVIAGFYTDSSYRIHVIVLSLFVALAGQAGDLSESLIKRDCGIKDSSNIIPGHGGILDRFDSLFFAAPVVYFYILIVYSISGGHS